MKTLSVAGSALVLSFMLVGVAVAAEGPVNYQAGKTYLVICGAEDSQGNFYCQRKLVDNTGAPTNSASGPSTQAKTGVALPPIVPGSKAATTEASTPPASAVVATNAASASAAPKPVPAAAAAASAAKAKTADEAIADLLQADLSIPASPAASLLGISGDKVQRPATIRELTASAIRGIGLDGKIKSAIAIDIAPAFVFFPSLIGAGDQYAPEDAKGDGDGDVHQRLRRILARTTFSFGTTNPDASGATRSAVGFRLGLFDSGDPGLYWSKVIRCVNTVGGVVPPPPPPPGTIGQPAPEIAVDYSKCDPTKDAAIDLWKRPSLYAGYGQSWYSKSGTLTDRAPDVKQVWLSGSAGWSPADSAQGAKSDLRLLGQLYFGRRLNDRTPDPKNAGQLLRQDSNEAVLRLRAGKLRWHGFLEYGQSSVRLGDDTKQNLRHTAVGAEFQLALLGSADNWLELASVRDRGYLDGKSHSGVLLNFRIGTPALAMPSTGPVTPK